MEKSFDKIHHLFMIKMQQTRNRVKLLQFNKEYKKSTANIFRSE